MSILSVLFLSLSFLPAKTAALPLTVEQGHQAFSAGDHRTALHIWRQLAAAGDPDAAYTLGRVYANGDQVPRDFGAAYGYFQQAMAAGHRAALGRVGMMLFRGEGAPKDAKTGVQYLSAAARQGDHDAAVFLKKMGVAADRFAKPVATSRSGPVPESRRPAGSITANALWSTPNQFILVLVAAYLGVIFALARLGVVVVFAGAGDVFATLVVVCFLPVVPLLLEGAADLRLLACMVVGLGAAVGSLVPSVRRNGLVPALWLLPAKILLTVPLAAAVAGVEIYLSLRRGRRGWALLVPAVTVTQALALLGIGAPGPMGAQGREDGRRPESSSPGDDAPGTGSSGTGPSGTGSSDSGTSGARATGGAASGGSRSRRSNEQSRRGATGFDRTQDHWRAEARRGPSLDKPPVTREDALQTLGLSEGFTEEELKHRYREFVSRYHPDKAYASGRMSQEAAIAKTQNIIDAYKILKMRYH